MQSKIIKDQHETEQLRTRIRELELENEEYSKLVRF